MAKGQVPAALDAYGGIERLSAGGPFRRKVRMDLVVKTAERGRVGVSGSGLQGGGGVCDRLIHYVAWRR